MNKFANTTSVDRTQILRVTVTGGGPVGLAFALLLDSLMGDRVVVKVYDGRWTRKGSRVVWKNEDQGNARRQQVVTLQSRQYLKLPQDVQDSLFQEGEYSEMWPVGPDSIRGYGPRNIRIARVEDQLLDIANEKKETIQLIPARFDPAANHDDIVDQHLLVICEGARSRTREYFIEQFGQADKSMYSLHGEHVQDVVLGLRVQSDLPDPMAVLLTVAQNRFLLNSLCGNGFLNMRLTDDEVKEVVGIDLNNKEFKDCIQSQPCVMERSGTSDLFQCTTHNTLFLPAMLRGSALWTRILEGLKLFGVREENLSAVTAFRLDMVQRPRFTTELFPPTPETLGTYGCLLGDAANAIHFWPGRGLNSGLASAISLARCLHAQWRGRSLRDADFLRHEAVMSMLQYRHKSRAWRAMVTVDSDGTACAIKDKIKQGIVEGENGQWDKEADMEELMGRMRQIRSRLESRVDGLPDDDTMRNHLRALEGHTLRTLVVSDAWDTANVGGEEVDVEWLFAEPEAPAPSAPKRASAGEEAVPVAKDDSLRERVNQAARAGARIFDVVHRNTPRSRPDTEDSHPEVDRSGYNHRVSSGDDGMTVVPPVDIEETTCQPDHTIRPPLMGSLVRATDDPNLPAELPIHGVPAAGERQIYIGRHSKHSALVINNKHISREHAIIIQRDGRLYIRDHASTSGTCVNWHTLAPGQERVLRDKDRIDFGPITYTFREAQKAV